MHSCCTWSLKHRCLHVFPASPQSWDQGGDPWSHVTDSNTRISHPSWELVREAFSHRGNTVLLLCHLLTYLHGNTTLWRTFPAKPLWSPAQLLPSSTPVLPWPLKVMLSSTPHGSYLPLFCFDYFLQWYKLTDTYWAYYILGIIGEALKQCWI